MQVTSHPTGLLRRSLSLPTPTKPSFPLLMRPITTFSRHRPFHNPPPPPISPPLHLAPFPTQDGKGRSAIHWACRHGKTHLVNLLLKADPHLAGILNKKKETCLVWAAVGGHANIVALLLKACPLLTKLKDRQGNTALHYA